MAAIFRTHSLPECVCSDNGPPFASDQFETFLEYLGIQHKKGEPYWPQSNGEVERCNETLLKIVWIVHLEKRDWRKAVHSTAQESQCHSISVPVWTAAWYACLDIPINGNNNTLLVLYYYIK